MGFCKRCGEIVSGERCKCGGTANGQLARLVPCYGLTPALSASVNIPAGAAGGRAAVLTFLD